MKRVASLTESATHLEALADEYTDQRPKGAGSAGQATVSKGIGTDSKG